MGFEIDYPAMVADELRDQRKAETAAARFCRDERVEQMTAEVFRHTRAIVLDAHHKRYLDVPAAARRRDTDTLLIAG